MSNWSYSYSYQPSPLPQQCGILAEIATYITGHGNAVSLTHWARPNLHSHGYKVHYHWGKMGPPNSSHFHISSGFTAIAFKYYCSNFCSPGTHSSWRNLFSKKKNLFQKMSYSRKKTDLIIFSFMYIKIYALWKDPPLISTSFEVFMARVSFLERHQQDCKIG